jgi:hypothetical protein
MNYMRLLPQAKIPPWWSIDIPHPSVAPSFYDAPQVWRGLPNRWTWWMGWDAFNPKGHVFHRAYFFNLL